MGYGTGHMQAHLTIAAISDRGLVRPHNEDAFAILKPPAGVKADEEADPAGSLLVVADGLGGHNAGEVASQIVINTLTERYHNGMNLAEEEDLTEALQEAHQSVLAAAAQNVFQQGMGTTVALVAVDGDAATVIHVGDSRVYLVRDGILSRLTLDHSWVEQQIMAGALPVEAAEEHPFRHVITQALGAMETIDPVTYSWQLRAGDLLLLCTDGLHGLIDRRAIHHVITTQPPDEAAHSLVELAKGNGGPDNITAIIARVDEIS